jgi:hypothetical protein
MENPSEHLEHIEHQQHAAQAGGFDRKVAVTMAIIAAFLATVTMLSHRAHNETLRLQGEANRFQVEANIDHTRAADQWGFYQAKNIRKHEYQAMSNLLKVMAPAAGKENEQAKQIAYWEGKAKEYEGVDDKKDDANEDSEKKSLKKIRAEAEHLEYEARSKESKAEKRLEESEHHHHRGFWLDMAQLAVELGLVLCSLAVLSKRAPFWFAGMASAAVGLVIASVALFIQ